MKDHSESFRGYYRSSKAWYAKYDVVKDQEIWFGMYHPEGGTTGEMSLKWIVLDNKPTPLLECFDDAWDVLAMFSDVITEMAKVENQDITEEQFVELLNKCGFKDLTQYEK
jgi:hypothetical protein